MIFLLSDTLFSLLPKITYIDCIQYLICIILYTSSYFCNYSANLLAISISLVIKYVVYSNTRVQIFQLLLSYYFQIIEVI